MKNLHKTILAMALLFCAMGLNAQNVCTIGKGTGHSLTFESSNKIVYEQKTDNVVLGHSVMEYHNPAKNVTETYSLTVLPDGVWSMLTVTSESGYARQVSKFQHPEGIIDEVEGGIYEVYVQGGSGDDTFFSTYLIDVNQNTEFHPTADADAIHEISFIGVDENGNSLSEKNIKEMNYDAIFHYDCGDDLVWAFCGDTYSDHLNGVRFNDLTEKDRITVCAPIHIDNQIVYFIEFPAIFGGSNNQGWTVGNNADDMKTHEEYFAVLDNSGPYYHLNYTEYVQGKAYLDSIRYMQVTGFNEELHYVPNIPLTVVTNINARGGFFEEGEVKYKVSFSVYQQPYEDEMPEDKVVSSSVYYTSEGELIREPMDVFLSTNFLAPVNALHSFEPSPISNYYKNKKSTCFGERTPISYFQSLNNSEEGYSYCSCELLFFGENGAQRYGDELENIKVMIDGEEMFNDNLYNYNMMSGYFDSEDPFIANIEITNSHLVCDNVEKTNKTIIDFDMKRQDAMPPTLTSMQVLDENNNEAIYLSNYSNSYINFTAGDFTGHVDELWGMTTYIEYFAKPSVEVYYSTENKDWTALDYTEIEDMFHVNYGNYFTIELSQLDESVLNQWVNLKFVVTDEAGNSQVQELSNVFYVGENTSVCETEGLSHNVYPNPFSNEVRIHTDEAINGNASISVFNVLGEQVVSKAMNCNATNEFVIDGSSLNAGIYFYNIATENGTLKGRIVKE